MNEIDKKIKEMKDEISRLKYEIMLLEYENSGYYIGVRIIEYRYTKVRRFCRLGYITEAAAKDWSLKHLSDASVISTNVFKVTKEKYDKYGEWRELYKLIKMIDNKSGPVNKLEDIEKYIPLATKSINDILEYLDINSRYPIEPDIQEGE